MGPPRPDILRAPEPARITHRRVRFQRVGVCSGCGSLLTDTPVRPSKLQQGPVLDQ